MELKHVRLLVLVLFYYHVSSEHWHYVFFHDIYSQQLATFCMFRTEYFYTIKITSTLLFLQIEVSGKRTEFSLQNLLYLIPLRMFYPLKYIGIIYSINTESWIMSVNSIFFVQMSANANIIRLPKGWSFPTFFFLFLLLSKADIYQKWYLFDNSYTRVSYSIWI